MAIKLGLCPLRRKGGEFRSSDSLSFSCQAVEVFHNSRLIRGIQQNTIYKRLHRLDRGLNPVGVSLAISHSNHYTRMFFVPV